MRHGGRTIIHPDGKEEKVAVDPKEGADNSRAHGYGEALKKHLPQPKIEPAKPADVAQAAKGDKTP